MAWRWTHRGTRSSLPSRRRQERCAAAEDAQRASDRDRPSACGWASTPERRTSPTRATSAPTCTARRASRRSRTGGRCWCRRRRPSSVDPSLLRDLGEHRLKDLTRPQRLHQLLGDGLPSDFPPLRTLDAATDEPAGSGDARLIGRERELRRDARTARARAAADSDGSGRSRQDTPRAAARGGRPRRSTTTVSSSSIWRTSPIRRSSSRGRPDPRAQERGGRERRRHRRRVPGRKARAPVARQRRAGGPRRRRTSAAGWRRRRARSCSRRAASLSGSSGSRSTRSLHFLQARPSSSSPSGPAQSAPTSR